jgi:glycopeptide antibiotics resistance protein
MFSIGIELIQFIWMLGWCEIDDVICNTLGAVLGFLVWQWLDKIKGE